VEAAALATQPFPSSLWWLRKGAQQLICHGGPVLTNRLRGADALLGASHFLLLLVITSCDMCAVEIKFGTDFLLGKINFAASVDGGRLATLSQTFNQINPIVFVV